MTKATSSVRALLPSMLVLGAVFYFINSACIPFGEMTSSSSSHDHREDHVPCPKGGLRAPKGAAIAITEPVDGATLVANAKSGVAEVGFRLKATGVATDGSDRCIPGKGRYEIYATSETGNVLAGGACTFCVTQAGSTGEFVHLVLAPDRYAVTARFVGPWSEPYQPELSSRIRVSVVAAGTDAGTRPPNPP